MGTEVSRVAWKVRPFLFLVSSLCRSKWDNFRPTAAKEAFPKNNTPNSKITAPNWNTNTSKPSTSSRCIAKAATANKSKTKCKPTCRKSKPTRTNSTAYTVKTWNYKRCLVSFKQRMSNLNKRGIRPTLIGIRLRS